MTTADTSTTQPRYVTHDEFRGFKESTEASLSRIERGFKELRDDLSQSKPKIPWGVLASWAGLFTTLSIAIIGAFVTLININTRQMIGNAEDQAAAAVESVARDVGENRDELAERRDLLDDIRKDRFTGAEGDTLGNRLTAIETAHRIRYPNDLPPR